MPHNVTTSSLASALRDRGYRIARHGEVYHVNARTAIVLSGRTVNGERKYALLRDGEPVAYGTAERIVKAI